MQHYSNNPKVIKKKKKAQDNRDRAYKPSSLKMVKWTDFVSDWHIAVWVGTRGGRFCRLGAATSLADPSASSWVGGVQHYTAK